MRKILICLTLLLTLGGAPAMAGDFWDLFSCDRGVRGSGDLTTESRDLDDFTIIESTGSADIFIKVGEKQSVEVTIDDNLIDLIRTRVRGNRLKISSEENYSSRRGCRIDITVPALEKVKLSGSGDIEVVNLDNEHFEFRLSGSGKMMAEGKTKELILKLSGSGDINTRELVADDVEASVSGSGDIEIFAKESFDGRITGSGTIRYYGDPEVTSKSVTGSGRIRRR